MNQIRKGSPWQHFLEIFDNFLGYHEGEAEWNGFLGALSWFTITFTIALVSRALSRPTINCIQHIFLKRVNRILDENRRSLFMVMELMEDVLARD